MSDNSEIEFVGVPSNKSLIQEAKNNPSGWVYDVDFEYHPSDFVPPEAIRGAWEVSKDGELTGNFIPNKNYRPIEQLEPKLSDFYYHIAENYKGIWISEIEKKSEILFPNIKSEMIVGYWYIDTKGQITNKFRPNSKYKNGDF